MMAEDVGRQSQFGTGRGGPSDHLVVGKKINEVKKTKKTWTVVCSEDVCPRRFDRKKPRAWLTTSGVSGAEEMRINAYLGSVGVFHLLLLLCFLSSSPCLGGLCLRRSVFCHIAVDPRAS